ncbi:MAG TPA: hypothetical protein VK628_05910, partial [Flavitalea sp.]|nr:hypothetical protein [Flavitalea sp.]
ADEKKMVVLGRATVVFAMLIAIIFTWSDVLGIGGEGGFTFIQKYTGFISPGVFAMFILGMFWKRTTGAAAIAGVITGFVLSVVFNIYAPEWFGHETWLYTSYPTTETIGGVAHKVWRIPFLLCMGFSFFFTVALMVAMSLSGPKINPKAFELDKSMFKLSPAVLTLIITILLILSLIYLRFW